MPVVSSVVPIRPDCRYAGSFPHIKGVGDSISFVGGINQPKLIQVRQ